MRAKWAAFIDAYFLHNFNATKAAEEVGFAHPRQAGSRLLTNVDIRAEIRRRIDEKAMSADEVLYRLAEQARGEYAQFFDADGRFNIYECLRAGKGHLIKKLKTRTVVDGDEMTYLDEVEFYDSHAALVDIGRNLALFVDRKDITSGGEPIKYIEVVLDGSGDEEA